MKGDVVTDMSILGTLGYVMSATWARSKQSKNYLDGAFNAFGTSFNASVEQAILRNAGAAATAIKNHSVSDLLISYLTSLENIISPRGLFDLVEYNSYVPDKTLLTDKEKVLAPLKMRFFGGDKKNIPPTIDMFGEEVKRYGDSDSWVASYFLGTRTLQIDPAKEKLAKMYLELETNKDLQKGVYPTKPEPSITINGKKVELTKDEYLEYQKMIGKSRFDWIKYTFDGASIEDEDKNTMVFEDLNEAQKIDAIKDSYSKGYNQGVKNFIEVNPKFEEANFEDETNRVSIQGKPD
jgi:hypothetical protein